MVGIAGTVGAAESADPMFESLVTFGPEQTSAFEVDPVSIGVSLHERFSENQPVETEGGAYVWLFGEVYGHGEGADYESRFASHSDVTRAEYIAALYDQHGDSFIEALNGEYAGAIYDPTEDEFALFTDRLGSRAIFYKSLKDGPFIFSSLVRSLAQYPSYEPSFDVEYLYEWFGMDRALGCAVPLDGVRKVPPASVLRIDLSDLSTTVERFWQPEYDPVDRPLSDIVDDFVDIFGTVLDERTADDVRYGLLLSGGTDSRAILAGLGGDVDCYTMSGWMNREARIAKRSAESVGAEFTLLERDRDYQARALETNPSFSNFVGRFHHAHATGFQERMADEVDVLLSGQFCDTFFKGHFLPIPEFPIDQISTIDLPVCKSIDSVDEYVEHMVEESHDPSYLEHPPELATILRDNIVRESDGVRSHGVHYPSLRDLVLTSEYYPLTNQPDSFFYESLVQMLPYRSPFLDNRLIDLHLSIPVKYLLRRNIPNRVTKRLSPELAELPHSTTGVPLKFSFPLQYAGQKVSTLVRRFLPVDEPPESHQRQTSWTDHKSLIREHDYVEQTLRDYEGTIESYPFLDGDSVDEVYQRHLEGEQRMPELYALITFLKMPLSHQLAELPSNRQPST